MAGSKWQQDKLSIENKAYRLDASGGVTRRLSMKVAKIKRVDVDKNQVDLEWIWPIRGGISKIDLTKPYIGFRSGINFMPESGSIVIVGYAFNQPILLSYALPGDFEAMLDGVTNNAGDTTRIRKLKEGEISINSLQDSEIYVHKKIEIRDGQLDSIIINPDNGTISLSSLNLDISNEAGDLKMGMVQRIVTDDEGNPEFKTITDDGQDITADEGGNALTEFKVTVNEFSDATLGNNTENQPIAEVTVGTVVDSDGKKVLNQAGNEIVCEINFASGAILQIDKKGKFNVNQGNMDKPTEPSAPSSSELTDQPGTTTREEGAEESSSYTFSQASQQRAAREGDRVTIPLTVATPPDLDHPELLKKTAINLQTMQQLAASFISPMGPCTFVPVPNLTLIGEITQGSDDFFIGSIDKNKEKEETQKNQ